MALGEADADVRVQHVAHGSPLCGLGSRTAPVALVFFMKFPAIGHEVGAEHGKEIADVGQGFLHHQAQHQGVANTLKLDILRRVNEA